ncbi:MAG: transposase [Chloroflexi bacterium]|nr:transposase [Chloroflexota bacterium]
MLYSDKTSRPNIAVNVMVSLEFLKAGHGWSDEEMYDQFQYNLQVRYALGLHDFEAGSDIEDASRLQLVVTAIKRAARLLDESQKASYADVLATFQEGEAEQYVYRVKGREATQTALQTGGELLAQLLAELGDAEAGEAHISHQAVKRLFADNFCLTAEGTVRVKGNDEIRAGALQSLDDLEATFRRKGETRTKGTSLTWPKPATHAMNCNSLLTCR